MWIYVKIIPDIHLDIRPGVLYVNGRPYAWSYAPEVRFRSVTERSEATDSGWLELKNPDLGRPGLWRLTKLFLFYGNTANTDVCAFVAVNPVETFFFFDDFFKWLSSLFFAGDFITETFFGFSYIDDELYHNLDSKLMSMMIPMRTQNQMRARNCAALRFWSGFTWLWDPCLVEWLQVVVPIQMRILCLRSCGMLSTLRVLCRWVVS